MRVDAALMMQNTGLRFKYAVVALAAAACGNARSSASTGGEGQAVIGGTVDPGDPSVVALLSLDAVQNGNVQELCTGSVISPHVVLTAAHCVPPNIIGAVALVGTDLSQPDTISVLSVVGGSPHPSYDPASGAHDVGFMVLQNPALVAPLPYNRSAVDGYAGQSGRVVGFGVTSTDKGAQSGVKETASVNLSSVSATRMMTSAYPAQPCHGDSGGPLFLTIDGNEQVAGIVSQGLDSSGGCSKGSANTRVDTELDFIDTIVAQVEAAAADAGTAYPSGSSTSN